MALFAGVMGIERGGGFVRPVPGSAVAGFVSVAGAAA
jgi:hypothetical protein